MRALFMFGSILSLALTAGAQIVENGGFETGSTAGWIVTDTVGGVGAPGIVVPFDIDDAGPFGTSLAAGFNAGQSPTALNTQGVELTQSVLLEAGKPYLVRLDYAAQNTGSATFAPPVTEFRVIVEGLTVTSASFTNLGPGVIKSGTLESEFTPSTTGSYILRILITRLGDGVPDLTQWIDGVTIGPAPNTYCLPKANSLGCVPMMTTSGTASLSSSGTLELRTAFALNNKSGLLFYGVNGPLSIQFFGGTLCVAPPLRRTAIQSSGGNPPPNDCSGVFTFEFNSWLQSGIDPFLTAGTSVHAQFWYRDPADAQGVGLSDGAAFEIGS